MTGRRWCGVGRRLRLVSVLVGVVLALSSCYSEERDAIEVTFTNDTDRNIATVILTHDKTLEEVLGRGLQATYSPGSSWRIDGFLGEYPDEGEPWCVVGRTYLFIAPVDPTITSNGAGPRSPVLGVDEVDVIDTIKEPCWPERTGNAYSITE